MSIIQQAQKNPATGYPATGRYVRERGLEVSYSEKDLYDQDEHHKWHSRAYQADGDKTQGKAE